MIKIAFVGNPNVGKTALINNISNANLKIGNWPGVTVEKKEAFFNFNGQEVNLIDLPGIYNLTANTPEERITREFILEEDVDVVINVIDSTALERNLYLTMLLKELGKPMIIALNFNDEFNKLGYKLNKSMFEKLLGIDVINTSGRTGEGINNLISKAIDVANIHKSTGHIQYQLSFDDYVEEEISSLKNKIKLLPNNEDLLQKYSVDFLAIKTLEEDLNIIAKIKVKYGIDLNELAKEEIDNLKKRYDIEPEEIISRARFGAAKGISQSTLERNNIGRFQLTDKIDKILLNKFFGTIIFFLCIYAMFVIIFDGSSPFIDWVDGFFANFVLKYTGYFINGTPDWLQSFILDGFLGSLGAVLTFVPLMFFIYFFMSLLEESGYMARVAFLMNKVMSRVGLSGKAFIPMLLGFGCTVPAVYATRTLEDERTRRLTGVVSTFMSCGARLPVYSLLAAAFFGKDGAFVVISIYFVGVFVALLSAWVLSKFKYFKGNNSELLIELPPYRLPSFKVVWNNMKTKTMAYVKRATTVIVGVLMIIWVFSYFPNNGDVQTSYIARGAKIVQPVFKPTGFADRWEPVASLVPSIIAKETVVGFLGQVLLLDSDEKTEEEIEYNFFGDLKDQVTGLALATMDSIKGIFNIFRFRIDTLSIQNEEDLEDAGGQGIISAIRELWNDEYKEIRAYSFMLFVLLVVPCAVALGALKQEFGGKLVTYEVIGLLVFPYLVSTIFFNIAKLFI